MVNGFGCTFRHAKSETGDLTDRSTSGRALRQLRSLVGIDCILTLALLALESCSFQNFDYLQQEQANESSLGGNSSSIGATSGGGNNANGFGGTSQANSANTTGGLSSVNSGIGGTTTVGAPPPVGPWNFDSASDTRAWIGNTACSSVNWIADGLSSPLGAMTLTATTSCEARFDFATGAMDLSKYTLHATVRREPDATDASAIGSSAATADIRPYVFSTGWVWADGGAFGVGTTWTNVSLRINSPFSAVSGYDSTQITAVGLQIISISKVSVDAIWLQ